MICVEDMNYNFQADDEGSTRGIHATAQNAKNPGGFFNAFCLHQLLNQKAKSLQNKDLAFFLFNRVTVK